MHSGCGGFDHHIIVRSAYNFYVRQQEAAKDRVHIIITIMAHIQLLSFYSSLA